MNLIFGLFPDWVKKDLLALLSGLIVAWTVFSNAQPILNFAKFVNKIVDKWNEYIGWISFYIASFFDIDLFVIDKILLSASIFLIINILACIKKKHTDPYGNEIFVRNTVKIRTNTPFLIILLIFASLVINHSNKMNQAANALTRSILIGMNLYVDEIDISENGEIIRENVTKELENTVEYLFPFIKKELGTIDDVDFFNYLNEIYSGSEPSDVVGKLNGEFIHFRTVNTAKYTFSYLVVALSIPVLMILWVSRYEFRFDYLLFERRSWRVISFLILLIAINYAGIYAENISEFTNVKVSE